MTVKNVGTHRTHCCVLHGCKYGHDECPVVSGEILQEYPCEDCDYCGIKSVDEIIDIKKGEQKTCPNCGRIIR